ncbi:hypothetical protein FAM15061_000829 [Propionibacterium freudenreichii]|uniref:hypothetical protein n=1 Tax=Propionibacterium freudenreichii TaxID=1744 RepID=UPI0021A75AC3|nr:hypothetical protein [Propionibacterium freudenreichii]MCT3014242.1 hypothetical protein [Propionibacterium freudenreichii]MDK9610947.1 hypothetical protein [Propionibacterium freudenreichii]MDK9621775.1 hypothetical protein [Propionibacterium freudenreichii]MDK9622859.1 hypothetical protein [Propionibacterium freudenreichii]
MNLTGPRRSTPTDDEATAPVELPHVLVTVAEDGTLTAMVDGAPFPSPDGTAWTRATFGPLMDAITKDRTVAVRVEVRECDGSVFTDIIRPRTPRRAAPLPEKPVPDTRRSRHARRVPRLMEVTADGFVPGEDVAAAVIVSHTDATGTGDARALIDLDTLPDTAGQEVILLGRISGTFAVRRLT